MLKNSENLTSLGQNASRTSDVQNDVFFATGTKISCNCSSYTILDRDKKREACLPRQSAADGRRAAV